jgi:hypothetical protein
LTDSEGLAVEIHAPVAQGEIEALNQTGCTRAFERGPMAFGGNNLVVGKVTVGVANGTFAIVGRKRVPQFTTGLSRAVANGEANNPSRVTFKRQPYPELLPFVLHIRPQFVEFQFWSLERWCQALANRCEGLFFRKARMVGRLTSVRRLMPCCETPS